MTTFLATPDPGQLIEVRVREKDAVAPGIERFVLEHPDGEALPPFTAGSHVVVVTPRGMSRRYSLCNTPGERDRYVIAVKREPAGRGGSISMIDDVSPGAHLEISPPFNYFPLAEDASSHVLVAGGIGITPILAMARDLAARGADFRLEYCTPSPEATAFREELSAAEWSSRVRFHHDAGVPPAELPFVGLLRERRGETHLYCCGPRGLMNAVRRATSHWPSPAVHFEDFGTGNDPLVEASAGEDAFEVRLAQSGRTVRVPSGVSILEALRREGVQVPSSCESGTCGTCRTRLLEGVADHRDYVLDEDERLGEIMICVSRARSPRLVLDL
jgi:phthalate 4,5-dioxygenase reductase component